MPRLPTHPVGRRNKWGQRDCRSSGTCNAGGELGQCGPKPGSYKCFQHHPSSTNVAGRSSKRPDGTGGRTVPPLTSGYRTGTSNVCSKPEVGREIRWRLSFFALGSNSSWKASRGIVAGYAATCRPQRIQVARDDARMAIPFQPIVEATDEEITLVVHTTR
jgi:hypothetical protein